MMLSLTDRALKVLGPLLNRGLPTRKNTAGVSAQDGMDILMVPLLASDCILTSEYLTTDKSVLTLES